MGEISKWVTLCHICSVLFVHRIIRQVNESVVNLLLRVRIPSDMENKKKIVARISELDKKFKFNIVFKIQLSTFVLLTLFDVCAHSNLIGWFLHCFIRKLFIEIMKLKPGTFVLSLCHHSATNERYSLLYLTTRGRIAPIKGMRCALLRGKTNQTVSVDVETQRICTWHINIEPKVEFGSINQEGVWDVILDHQFLPFGDFA